MQNNSDTAISIILPVYNGLPFLESSVNSVLHQSYSNFEFLIIDDGSDDGSLAYLRTLNDTRIQLFVNETNKGLFYNLNFLIRKSSASLIKLWSQDDIMYPDCIEKIIRFHSKYPELGFSYTGRDIIDDKGKVILPALSDTTPEIIPTALHTRIAFFTGSIAGNIANVTIAQKALDTAGLFNESMTISGDFDMWVRIAEKYPVGFIKDSLVQLRNHPGQLSRQEKSYRNHLNEDLRVYENLMSYISTAEKKEGRRILRNHKLLFYYTLMVKAFGKGSFRTGMTFFKALSKFDNLWILSFYFFRNRIVFKKKYSKMHLDNAAFIEASPLQ